MTTKQFVACFIFLAVLSATAAGLRGQSSSSSASGSKDGATYRIRVNVNMVQLNVAVTDKKGEYVTGLRPADFAVFEDDIREKIATFAEENEPPRNLEDIGPGKGDPKLVKTYVAKVPRRGHERSSPDIFREVTPEHAASLVAGASVFILFDTSNYMYRGFVFAQDAIAEFVRSLGPSNRIAFYSYSRNTSRAATLTAHRWQVLRGVRATVAGDDAALYDALLLTLEDAAGFSGKRAVVVFSNGPDNSSVVAPEDVRELAQSEGVAIYMISTQEARLDSISTAVFERMSISTGGKAYFAKNWREQQKAFASVRDDLAHLYSLTYYPQPNVNFGWRRITVKLVGENLKRYHIRTRSGYRPKLVRAGVEITQTP